MGERWILGSPHGHSRVVGSFIPQMPRRQIELVLRSLVRSNARTSHTHRLSCVQERQLGQMISIARAVWMLAARRLSHMAEAGPISTQLSFSSVVLPDGS